MKPDTLGSVPKFRGLSPFVVNDLGGNFTKLMDAAMIGTEKQVDACIESFAISGETTMVGEGKRKSALFVAYLTWMSSRTLAGYQAGDPVDVTDYGRELVEIFFGEEILSKPELHPVPAALLQSDATIKINWRSAT